MTQMPFAACGYNIFDHRNMRQSEHSSKPTFMLASLVLVTSYVGSCVSSPFILTVLSHVVLSSLAEF